MFLTIDGEMNIGFVRSLDKLRLGDTLSIFEIVPIGLSKSHGR